MTVIGVGLIGASPLNPGWAVNGHIPALKTLPEYSIRAVSTNRPESARAASVAFDVPGFDNHSALIAHPDIDLVVITVRVPDHLKLVNAVLDAKKMVYCEWPLGNGLQEGIELATRAQQLGVRTIVGLQGRFAPAVCHARDLIAEGYVGEVLATTMVGSGIAWGPMVDRTHKYWFDIKNGATTLSVPTLHALDPLCYVLGEFESVSANLALRRKTATVVDDGNAIIPVTAPDQVAITGTLKGGALASVFYRGGVSRGVNLRWEINGSEGDLVLTSAIGNLQVADLKLEGGRREDTVVKPINIPAAYFELAPSAPEGFAANVARIYAQFARDLRDGTRRTPDFSHGVTRHRLLEAITTADRTGTVQKVRS
jgi:predicted dehydrogenase